MFSAFIATVLDTSVPVVSFSVNVFRAAGWDEAIVAGFMDWLKAAVTTVPVNLSLMLVLVPAFVAPLLGPIEMTIGGLAEGTIFADMRAPASATAPSPLPPHPATRAARVWRLATSVDSMGVGFSSFFCLLSSQFARLQAVSRTLASAAFGKKLISVQGVFDSNIVMCRISQF